VEDNKALLRMMWKGLWTDKGLDLIDEVFTRGVVLHVMGQDQAGREVARTGISAVWFASFPDISVTVEDQVAEGDKVCDRLLFSGTHTGTPYLGIPASGKPFRFTQTTISRIEGGRIAEIWEDFDFFNFIKQLGATIKRPTADE
jgi:predicted ester cyclase